jgi:hypothetical protein
MQSGEENDKEECWVVGQGLLGVLAPFPQTIGSDPCFTSLRGS